MSDASSVDAFLSQAKEREKVYDWLGTVELYRTALSMVSEQDVMKTGEINELIGYGMFRAAMQADSPDEFRKRMHMSVDHYEKAAELFKNAPPAQEAYCRGAAKYSEFWVVKDQSRKGELLHDCWRLTKEALEGFDTSRDYAGLEKAIRISELCTAALTYNALDSWQERERVCSEIMSYGQKFLSKFSQSRNADLLAGAYTMASYFVLMGLDLFEVRHEELRSMASDYLKKALAIREEIEDDYIRFFVDFELILASWSALFTWSNMQTARAQSEAVMKLAEKSNDHFLRGWGYNILAETASGEALKEEDPDKQKEKCNTAIRDYEESTRQFQLVCRDDMAGNAASAMMESYFIAIGLETSIEDKRALLAKAAEIGKEGLGYASTLWVMSNLCHSLSKAFYFLSEIETNVGEKRKLLQEALELRERTIRLGNQLNPPGTWYRGITQNYLALIKAEMAKTEEDNGKKVTLLEEAISSMEECLRICTRWVQSLPDESTFVAVGWYHDWFGKILNQQYLLTKDEKILDRAIKVCQSAAEEYQKAGMPSRVGEAYWKAAKLQDQRSEYAKAADNFTSAFKSYQTVAEKIPQLKDFYHDQALYMQAWSEIEKGRYHHARQEYGSAREHYEEAATIHKSLKKWSYLAPNYSAWTQVEIAEDLSRREQSEDAVRAFQEAAKLFTETEESLQTQLRKIADLDERQMATDMVKATNERREYCIGRIALEEAKILDKKGDHYFSSQKYSSAAEVFEKISRAAESEQDRKEFQLIITLSRAWEKMMLAEARASPELCLEASQLFEQSSQLSSSEKTSFLTLGHSRFCKALEAGTKFSDTGDVASHTVAIQQLESAAKYYVKAGFQSASEYAKATELLLDAYMHMDNAKKEPDPEKKARLYTMAEKVLQTSAGSFMKAEHPEKREQVLRLLEKVKEERELALSLSEVLHAPSVVSTTVAFTTPTPTKENAIGLETFEHADIQASIIARQRELKIGENLNLEVELVNAGKGPALLTKITELIPEGFELTERPEIYRVEDSYIDMKGKRLDPLKMVEVKLVLKPRVQGAFPIKPRVLYIDEDGKYKSHEPEPITITVKELGIRGWIKGER